MRRNGLDISEAQWWKFVEFAESEGISTEDEQDWGAWWDCWKNGYDRGAETAA